eukprot:gene5114-7125_t
MSTAEEMDGFINVSSIDLWASSKIIGRECAEKNMDYLLCTKANVIKTRLNPPFECSTQGLAVFKCTVKVVEELQTKFPTEFKSFAKCLDYSDYRHDECRKEEKALHDCWNNKAK